MLVVDFLLGCCGFTIATIGAAIAYRVIINDSFTAIFKRKTQNPQQNIVPIIDENPPEVIELHKKLQQYKSMHWGRKMNSDVPKQHPYVFPPKVPKKHHTSLKLIKGGKK